MGFEENVQNFVDIIENMQGTESMCQKMNHQNHRKGQFKLMELINRRDEIGKLTLSLKILDKERRMYVESFYSWTSNIISNANFSNIFIGWSVITSNITSSADISDIFIGR